MIKKKHIFYIAFSLLLICLYTITFVILDHEPHHIYFISQFLSSIILMIFYEIFYLNKKISSNEIVIYSLISSFIAIIFLIGFFKYIDLIYNPNLMDAGMGAMSLMNLTISPSFMDYVMLFFGFNFVILIFFLICKFETK